MKNKWLLPYFLSMCLLGLLAACSDDDKYDPNAPISATDVPEAILAQFNKDYPDAQHVEWQREGDYYTVDFSTMNSTSNTAWYNREGRWGMTKYEIPFDLLPTVVRDAFYATEYGQSGSEWRVEREVDVLERADGTETLYIIELKRGENEIDLYFTGEGVLVKEILDAAPDKNYGEYLPQSPDNSLQSWLEQRFPGYRLIDMDADNNGLEIEFVYERRKYEAFFTRGGEWLYYKTDLSYRSEQIPSVVIATVEASEAMQQGAWVEDVEKYVVNANGVETTYFCFELETRFGDGPKIYVRADGTEERPNLGVGGQTGSGVPVEGDVEAFIRQQYPDAIILERDYDDGYLEIDIRHEGVVKELLFNGRNEWVRTSWETFELPDAVRQAVEGEGYRIVDRDFERVETPDGRWYEVEAVKDRREWRLLVSDEGVILDTRYDD